MQCLPPAMPAPPAPARPVKFTLVTAQRISLGKVRMIVLGWNLSYSSRALCSMRHACYSTGAPYTIRFVLCSMPSSEFRIPCSEFGNALCPLRHACYSPGVRQFFKQVSHKAPSTHIEGGAFLLCPVDFCYSSGAHTISSGTSYGERSKRV